jgi:cytochrome b subunit of formate dehydrogenase
MTGLLLGTFGFFGVHSLLWLVRTLLVRARDPVAFAEQKARVRSEKGARLFTRFRPVDRFCHMVLIVSFLLLVATGMPIKFHQAGWAQVFFGLIGGPAVAASLHRFGAILIVSSFAIHLASLIGPLKRELSRRLGKNARFSWRATLRVMFGPDSPLPRWQDAKDLVAHMRWFFGRGARPKFDRFTYWEKFDYIAVFWGVGVIGLSGLVLWFPDVFTRVLPGWGINIAHIIHSDEALLAAGFIFTFHFFNSHFRPEKFPLDSVMFSGRITEEELRHERLAQYERLEREGRLDSIETRDEWPEWKVGFITFGTLAIALGVGLVVAIFWSALS